MLVMKRLLLIFIFTLSFQSLTKADDVNDFEIYGLSVGDSLLKFKSKSIFFKVPKATQIPVKIHPKLKPRNKKLNLLD